MSFQCITLDLIQPLDLVSLSPIHPSCIGSPLWGCLANVIACCSLISVINCMHRACVMIQPWCLITMFVIDFPSVLQYNIVFSTDPPSYGNETNFVGHHSRQRFLRTSSVILVISLYVFMLIFIHTLTLIHNFRVNSFLFYM